MAASRTTSPTAATSSRSSMLPRSALPVDPARAGELIDARAADHGRNPHRRRARCIPRTRGSPAATTSSSRAGPRRRRARNATAIHPGWLDRSPCGTGTWRGWPSCTPAASWRIGEEWVNESVIGTRSSGASWRRRSRRAPGGRARVSGRPGSPAGQYLLDPATRSRPASRCERGHDPVVVGGGIVGACAALELARGGATVEVLERGGGWGEGCSWGNAGLLVPSHARPIAAPESLTRRARLDGQAGLAVRPEAQAVARAVAGALPAGLDGAARGGGRGAAARSSAARASASSGSWRPRGSTAASTSRAASRCTPRPTPRSTRRPRPRPRRGARSARGC